MKMRELIWTMILTVSLVCSMTGIVAAQGGPAKDPPGKPMTSVTHDGSLTGDGTTASPLGIATAGVTAVTATAPLVSSGGTTPNLSLPGVIIDTSNTAIGAGALQNDTRPGGSGNTATGAQALQNN